ncbi:MAG: glycoside hydrolase family 3 N-terminal domain-containing protein, partial [Candidatus Sumerlaeia bacterium]|nr:glycoside hydrolase family 3 N-terminal domain-containing protein [Candidatus Sumerlaeia bacterium]
GYITGARAEGILCTYKHFPGHGPTQGDSHSSLPGVALTMDQLRAFHIKPYQDLVSGGNVDFVMTAHVWYSSVMGPTPYPSTLSPIFNKTILREEFGYNGLLISDAYNMSGLVLAVPDEKERAVRGIEAGLDVILHTGDISLFHQGILEAVQSNRLTVERIEESVVRILKAKSRAGLPERATVDPGLWPSVLQHPEHQALVRTISEEAITAFRPLGNGAPLQPGDSVIVFNLANNRSIFYNFNTSTFKSELLERYPGCTVVEVAKTPSNTSITGYMNQVMIGNYDKVLVVSTDFEKLRDAQQELLVDSLCTLSPPVVYVSLGSPYHIKQVPNVDAFYCGYTTVPAMQEVAVEALVGERLAPGIPPVNLPEFHSRVFDQLLFW